MTKQQMTSKARRETKNELAHAIKNRIERGTVVTSTGNWIAFTVKYFSRIDGSEAAAITLKGHECYDVNSAAAAALYEWGYVR